GRCRPTGGGIAVSFPYAACHSLLLGKGALASPTGPVQAARSAPQGSLDGWRRCVRNEQEGMAGDITRSFSGTNEQTACVWLPASPPRPAYHFWRGLTCGARRSSGPTGGGPPHWAVAVGSPTVWRTNDTLDAVCLWRWCESRARRMDDENSDTD